MKPLQSGYTTEPAREPRPLPPASRVSLSLSLARCRAPSAHRLLRLQSRQPPLNRRHLRPSLHHPLHHPLRLPRPPPRPQPAGIVP
eukprot:2887453-Rhodomonas_salina.1